MDANVPTHVDASDRLAISLDATDVSATVARVRVHVDHLDLVALDVPHVRGDHIDHTTLGIMIDLHHLMKRTISRRDALHLDILTLNEEAQVQEEWKSSRKGWQNYEVP